MLFQESAIECFVGKLKGLSRKESHHKSGFMNQMYLIMLGKMLKMFALLDEMKNMKASMKNDFSHFKRFVIFYSFFTFNFMQSFSIHAKRWR